MSCVSLTYLSPRLVLILRGLELRLMIDHKIAPTLSARSTVEFTI